MIPVQFPESNDVLARDQGEYEPLPIYRFGDQEGRVAFCCRLSPAEIDEICRTRTLWIQQLTFGRHFQPIGLSTQRPQDLPTPAQPTCVHDWEVVDAGEQVYVCRRCARQMPKLKTGDGA